MGIGRIVGKAARYVFIGAAIVYAADWSVFELRMARGTALGRVTVEHYLRTTLKGNKEEYDFLGSEEESCSRSLLPQYAASDWNPPCWWLARHRMRWQVVASPALRPFTAAKSYPPWPASQ